MSYSSILGIAVLRLSELIQEMSSTRVLNVSFTKAKSRAVKVQQCKKAHPQHPCFFSPGDPAMAVKVVNSLNKNKNYFSAGRMDTNSSVEVLLGSTFEDQRCESLSNLACMGA